MKDGVRGDQAERAIANAINEEARRVAAGPEVQSAIADALHGSRTGLAALQPSLVEAAVTKAVTEEARQVIARSDIRSEISDVLQGTRYGLSSLGLTGNRSLIESAVTTALAEATRDLVATSDVKSEISDILAGRRSGSRSIGNPWGPSIVESAVVTALTDGAKRIVDSPEVQVDLHNAVHGRHSTLGALGPTTIQQAADRALIEVARNAAAGPDVQEAVSRALRVRAAGGSFATDPAVTLELGKHSVNADVTPEIKVDEPLKPIAGQHSARFTGPGSFFGAHEVQVTSFAQLTQEITQLASRNPGLKFVWRGQQNADWGLHSSLYRRLLAHRGVLTGGALLNQESGRPFPDETALLSAELAMLNDAAAEWRMSEVTALELFARLQHHGGPTRLLDVTRNPLIAAWFAVEMSDRHREVDGRLFAIATTPAPPPNAQPDHSVDPLLAEILAGKRYPFWSDYRSAERRTAAQWGTGTRRRLWVPPAYDARIAAQNAAFLLEGVPMLTAKNLRLFADSDGESWQVADVAASMSIYARPAHPGRKARSNKAQLAPLFSFRIVAEAKAEIYAMLNSTYGYTTSLVYPDIQGMSTQLASTSDWLNVSNGSPSATES